MLKCSKEAFAACPDRHGCGCLEEAVFLEGSECDQFNREIARRPVTNGDRIRAMSDKELARFVATKIVNLESYKMAEQGHTPTAIQLSVLGETMYCTLMDWLQQPAEVSSCEP